ncbi:hypothetical protein CPB85DRAFT_564793 [Mucidula mucida]|nr:hypothetical protein CPB85DRAFT_564793 [Mucidula mucida]
MVQQARKRSGIPSWNNTNLDEQIVKRSRFSSTACLPAHCQAPIRRRFASDPGPRRHKAVEPETSWPTSFELTLKRGSRSWMHTTSHRHRTREARMRARMRRLEYGMPISVSMGSVRMGEHDYGRCEVEDERRRNAEERRRREEAFKRNEDALAQLQSLLDMLPTVKDEACEVVQVADEDFIHPVIFAGVLFLIMIILLNLPTYVQPIIFLGYSK